MVLKNQNLEKFTPKQEILKPQFDKTGHLKLQFVNLMCDRQIAVCGPGRGSFLLHCYSQILVILRFHFPTLKLSKQRNQNAQTPEQSPRS